MKCYEVPGILWVLFGFSWVSCFLGDFWPFRALLKHLLGNIAGLLLAAESAC